MTSSALNGPVRQQKTKTYEALHKALLTSERHDYDSKVKLNINPMANKFKMASRFAAAACYPTPGPLFHKETTVYYHETNVSLKLMFFLLSVINRKFLLDLKRWRCRN